MAKGPEPVGKFDADGKWTKTDRVWIPEIGAEAQIRIDRIKNELNLEKRAAEDGSHNLPAVHDATLNEPQLQICGRIFAGILMLNQFLDEQIASALKDARALKPPRPDAEHAKAQIEAAMQTVFDEHRRELIDLRKLDLEKHRDLRFFKHQNQLFRKAEYKSSLIKVVAIIFAMFLAESLLNGALFSQVVEDGLLGGAILAGFISAINILTGVVAGLVGWRYAGHKNKYFRAFGIILTLICHGLAVSWNLLVAHFREVAENFASQDNFNFDAAKLSNATAAHIHANGFFGVTSLQSWGLFLIGIFIHFVAAKEGWDDFADRYPEYKKKDLLAATAHDAFEDGVAILRQAGRGAIEAVENSCKAAASDLRRAFELCAHLVDVAVQRKQEVRDSEDEWVVGGNELLRAYRETNVKIRDEGTTPAYFDAYPSPKQYRERDFGAGLSPSEEIVNRTRSAESSIAELVSLRDQAKTEASQAEGILKDVHRLVAAALKAMDEQIDSESKKITRDLEKELRKEDAEVRRGPIAPNLAETAPANETR
jgi:hypothetical protein